MNIYIKYISAKKLSDHLLYEKMKSSIEISNIINVITYETPNCSILLILIGIDNFKRDLAQETMVILY